MPAIYITDADIAGMALVIAAIVIIIAFTLGVIAIYEARKSATTTMPEPPWWDLAAKDDPVATIEKVYGTHKWRPQLEGIMPTDSLSITVAGQVIDMPFEVIGRMIPERISFRADWRGHKLYCVGWVVQTAKDRAVIKKGDEA